MSRSPVTASRLPHPGCGPAKHIAQTSETERRGTALDELVDLAGTGDFHAFDEIALLVAARLDAGRARPQTPPAREKVLDQGSQRLQRHHDRAVDRALANEIDRASGQKCRDAQAGGHATVRDGESDRGQLVIGAMRDEHDEFAGRFRHAVSPLHSWPIARGYRSGAPGCRTSDAKAVRGA